MHKMMHGNLHSIFVLAALRKLHFVTLLFLILCVSSCNTSPPVLQPLVLTSADSIKEEMRIGKAIHTIYSLGKLIKTGDLITRTGNDFTSESLRKLNQRDKTYSHCGIASIENDSLVVYHALGGEFNPNQKLMRQPFLLFAEPYSNRGIGIYRLHQSVESVPSLIQIAKKLYYSGLPFDMAFDLQTNDRMYCAEFVSKTYNRASNNKLQFSKSKIGNFEFIGVDDIFLHPAFQKIIAVNYK